MKSIGVELTLLVVTLFAGIAANVAPSIGFDKNNHSFPLDYPTPYPTPYPITETRTFKSAGTYDGWILESTETSSTGGTMNSTSTTIRVGDATADRQYRAILHFDTSSLPNTAVVTHATLKIRKQATVGTNPFSILGKLYGDVRKPSFGTAALALNDFGSMGKNNIASFGMTPVSNWYSAVLDNVGLPYINRTGTTQFRLHFITDDNDDNGNDYMKFFSGNESTMGYRPLLIVEYYVP